MVSHCALVCVPCSGRMLEKEQRTLTCAFIEHQMLLCTDAIMGIRLLFACIIDTAAASRTPTSHLSLRRFINAKQIVT